MTCFCVISTKWYLWKISNDWMQILENYLLYPVKLQRSKRGCYSSQTAYLLIRNLYWNVPVMLESNMRSTLKRYPTPMCHTVTVAQTCTDGKRKDEGTVQISNILRPISYTRRVDRIGLFFQKFTLMESLCSDGHVKCEIFLLGEKGSGYFIDVSLLNEKLFPAESFKI